MELNKISKALFFAKTAHKGQKRKGTNNDYITHPVEVYKLLSHLTTDEHILCSAILHDVIEDTETTYEDIKKEFGSRVSNIVLEVTKDSQGRFNITSREGLMVKLADMLHNIHNSTDSEYIQKKIKFIANN